MTDETNPPFDVAETAPAKPPKKQTATALAIKEVNSIVSKFDGVAASLAALSNRHKDVVFAVATTKGMEEAKAARMEIRQVRFAVQNALDAAKAPLNTLKADITSRANEIIAQITPLEEPIDAQIKVEEKRKADEKAERERIEAEAKAAIDARIAAFGDTVVNCVGMSSADIELERIRVESMDIDIEAFGDRTGEAWQLKARAIGAMAAMRDGAKVAEDAQAAIDRERAKLAEDRRAEEERQETERKAEADRVESQRVANEKAAKELADQRAAFQKEQDEARATRQATEDAERKKRQDAEDAERAAAREAEQVLIDKRAVWRTRINAMKGLVLLVRTVSEIDDAIGRIGNLDVTAEHFGEFAQEAGQVQTEVLATLAERRVKAVEDAATMQRQQDERAAEEARDAADKKERDAAPIMLEALREIRSRVDSTTAIWTIADGAIHQATAKE